MANECNLNLKRNLNRKRSQYFWAPILSLIICSGLYLCLSFTGIFNKTGLTNITDLATKSSISIDKPSFKETEAKKIDSPKQLEDLEKATHISAIILILSICIIALGICLFGLSSIILSLAQTFIVAVVLIFTKSYPRWMFEWNKGVITYYFNFLAYNWLLIDELPAINGENNQLTVEVPEAPSMKLSRFMPIVKWILVIPQFIMVSLLKIMIILLSTLLWPYLFITSKPYPARLHRFILGLLEWELTVLCYSNTLFTDQYPKFSFKSKAD